MVKCVIRIYALTCTHTYTLWGENLLVFPSDIASCNSYKQELWNHTNDIKLWSIVASAVQPAPQVCVATCLKKAPSSIKLEKQTDMHFCISFLQIHLQPN